MSRNNVGVNPTDTLTPWRENFVVRVNFLRVTPKRRPILEIAVGCELAEELKTRRELPRESSS